MNNDLKYYCPKIDEIFIGYECEYFNPYANPQWENRILDIDVFNLLLEDDIFDEMYFRVNYRTKYLDEEDVLKLGFKTRKYTPFVYNKDNIYIDFFDLNDVIICTHDKHYDIDYLFRGYCPSINELRKILKLVTHEIN